MDACSQLQFTDAGNTSRPPADAIRDAMMLLLQGFVMHVQVRVGDIQGPSSNPAYIIQTSYVLETNDVKAAKLNMLRAAH